MIIRYFYDEKLAQASYLVGCGGAGQAIVIDPLRDVEQYVRVADEQGLEIVAVTETHIHADYLSGSRELAARTGAKLYVSDEGDATWKYAFGHEPNVVLLKDGDTITIGNLSLRAMHTPGHTPEHLVFLLTDHGFGELPHSMFSGDFIFAGDVGRPDLLERAANFAGTMEAGARRLFQSLQLTKDLPDSLLIWPGHGAGSACGKSLGGSPVTTLGYERATNWAFKAASEERFVDEVLSGQPEPPVYFKEMKRMNKLGPAILGGLPQVSHGLVSGSTLVDVREKDTIRQGYLEGSIAIPNGKGLTNWAGWLLDYSATVTLIADSQDQANQAARDMMTIGLDNIVGWVTAEESNRPTQHVATVEASAILETDFVLDVRGLNEWNEAHIREAHHIPLGYLQSRMDEVPSDRRIVVHCAAGGRSPIAVSLLLKSGRQNVVELPGGLSQVQCECPALLV